MPEAGPLAAIREDIDRRPNRIKRVLADARVRREFLGGVADDQKKVVGAFVRHNAETALKTKPKVRDSGLHSRQSSHGPLSTDSRIRLGFDMVVGRSRTTCTVVNAAITGPGQLRSVDP